jgi:hypothetical protein
LAEALNLCSPIRVMAQVSYSLKTVKILCKGKQITIT